MSVTGSCLCGENTFVLEGELTSPRYCHCDNCRKFSGTSPATWLMVDTGQLTITQNNAPISEYNSGRGIRCFCSLCGSPLWFKSVDFPQIMALPLGVVDQGELPQPEMHLWFDSKPHWCMVNHSLPKFEQGPPAPSE